MLNTSRADALCPLDVINNRYKFIVYERILWWGNI
jgi:hypothetical protein